MAEPTAAAGSLQLIRSKLQPPPPRRRVDRPRLVAGILAGPAKLILIRAPAGWGKSTLAAELCDGRAGAAWLSLEPSEAEPVRFWLYVVEALRGVEPSVGEVSGPLLTTPGTDLVDEVLPVLLNECAALPGGSLLTLEDFHAIGSGPTVDSVAFFVEHLPPNLSVAITSRTEPRLPLARLRARGELVEVGIDELGFSADEAEQLLNDLLALGVDRADAVRLRERTEGWAAGLHLAALSLRGMPDRRRFIDEFTGGERHIVDYFATEVLAQQPVEIQEFLVRTSILSQLCAPLCTAIGVEGDAAAVLQELERTNVFLLPLDSRREWYRYHHLFASLLRLELGHRARELVPELHRRAAAWYLGHGRTSDAIAHLIEGGDLSAAGDVVAEHWAPTLFNVPAGDRVIEGWLDALPESAVAADARLCIARCYVGESLGRLDDVPRWVERAEAAPVLGPWMDGFSSKEGALACVRAGYYAQIGDVGNGLRFGDEASQLEGPTTPWHGVGLAAAAFSHAGRGEWDEARRNMLTWVALGRAAGLYLPQVSGLGFASAFESELGEWPDARAHADESRELSTRHGFDEHWISGPRHVTSGLLAERAGELGRAAEALGRAALLLERGAGPLFTAMALVHLARVRATAGDRAGADEALHDARLVASRSPDPGIVPSRIAAQARRLGGGGVRVETEQLSERELSVLRLLTSPLSMREIGAELFVSLNTVKSHTRAIFRKLGVQNRLDAVARARTLDLV